MKIGRHSFDESELLQKKRRIKKILLAENETTVKKKIAILGGSTTNDIADMLELFLLAEGIEPVFYQSEYGMYWEDGMFGNNELDSFKPDIVLIHTSWRNIRGCDFAIADLPECIEAEIESEYKRFESLWNAVEEKFHCPVIQNNFDMPYYRLLGNKDSVDVHGKLWVVNSLNMKFSQYAQTHKNFYINDINYVSACFGLDRWGEPIYWFMYKYAMHMEAIPHFAKNAANIVKSILGKNKKVLTLDLDNTIWGGVVGDDGVDGLDIGPETSSGQGYFEFQRYVKKLKDLGIMLTVCSKNDEKNAIAGLNHQNCILKPDDFIVIKANWDNKDRNISTIATELNILPESIVFVDDNPMERDIVKTSLPKTAVVDADNVESFIMALDREGYFEMTLFSDDDMNRNEMYKENMQRKHEMESCSSYGEYLESLDMNAIIANFEPVYLERIVQLTNKSNQFNLTTKRYTSNEVYDVFESKDYIRLYGKLSDKFGDNGIVSVVIGHKNDDTLDVDLWLMSCRVLKRGMEYAMLDTLVSKCMECGISKVKGYYYKTAKNSMVKELYKDFGFVLISDDGNDNTVWELMTENYEKKNHIIKVNEERIKI